MRLPYRQTARQTAPSFRQLPAKSQRSQLHHRCILKVERQAAIGQRRTEVGKGQAANARVRAKFYRPECRLAKRDQLAGGEVGFCFIGISVADRTP